MIEDQLFELTLNKHGKVANWLVENLTVTGSKADLLAAGDILSALSQTFPPGHGPVWEDQSKSDVMGLAEKVVPFWFLVTTIYRTREASNPEKVYVGVKLGRRDELEGSGSFTYIDPPYMELSGLNEYSGPYSPEHGLFVGGTVGRFMFLCPECTEGMSPVYSGQNGLHVGAARVAPWQDDGWGAAAAEIALFCEDGHEITFVISNRKGLSFAHWRSGCEWATPDLCNIQGGTPWWPQVRCNSCGNLFYVRGLPDPNEPPPVCQECRDPQD